MLLGFWAAHQHSLAVDRACAAEPEAVYSVWLARGRPDGDGLLAFVESLRSKGMDHLTVARERLALEDREYTPIIAFNTHGSGGYERIYVDTGGVVVGVTARGKRVILGDRSPSL